MLGLDHYDNFPKVGLPSSAPTYLSLGDELRPLAAMDPVFTITYVCCAIYIWGWISDLGAEYNFIWSHSLRDIRTAQVLYLLTRCSALLCHGYIHGKTTSSRRPDALPGSTLPSCILKKNIQLQCQQLPADTGSSSSSQPWVQISHCY